eukprot:CAMPEP_0176338602 /NCGR_PEP_ID=MMETSP0126-20121128/83_1 /TAXON_ID=141414 ORGANISM="Strombidinopsis acuminatum, Strain SPMC142" /NCGR_SAMPLE_ID=MMETSP0126 /ASSEMBLY_ACC=CAM_ASM_000229 /LENGTH=51 /DNA_ID=CAMNT_0017681665 /DNA_START=582 /DNA_END=737 /DNA_ORIENTATION=+
MFKLFSKYHIQHDIEDIDVFKLEQDMFFDEGFKPDTDKLDMLIYKEIFPDH